MSDAQREDRPDHEAIAERLGVDASDPGVQADLKRLASDPNLKPTPDAQPPRGGTADPGWYSMKGGRHRWWDGTAWTDHWSSSKPKWSNSAILGMLLAIFIPFIGFFVGLALIAGRDPHAHWVVLTSILVPVLALVLLTS